MPSPLSPDIDLSARIPEHHSVLNDNMPSKYTDPCKQAAMQSMRCLDKNGHDKTVCHNEFFIYRQCKKEFMRQRREQRGA